MRSIPIAFPTLEVLLCRTLASWMFSRGIANPGDRRRRDRTRRAGPRARTRFGGAHARRTWRGVARTHGRPTHWPVGIPRGVGGGPGGRPRIARLGRRLGGPVCRRPEPTCECLANFPGYLPRLCGSGGGRHGDRRVVLSLPRGRGCHLRDLRGAPARNAIPRPRLISGCGGSQVRRLSGFELRFLFCFCFTYPLPVGFFSSPAKRSSGASPAPDSNETPIMVSEPSTYWEPRR